MNNELYHHGIMGMKWGHRRWQNEDGSYKPGGEERYYTPKQQKKEFKVFNKSQSKGYRNYYDRMKDYSKKSKVIQERSKELTDLADKARDLDSQYDDYIYENEKVREKATEMALKKAKKEPYYDEKFEDDIINYFLYDEDYLEKAADQLFKNNAKYNQVKKDRNKAISNYKSKCKQITDQIVGEYGDKKVSGLADVKNLKYKEVVYHALTDPHTMWMFTSDDKIGRT